MTVRCAECGGATTWDDTASSAICTSCGTLTDASQSILTSHLDQQNNHHNSTFNPALPTVFKSLRTGSNWDLSGQGKEGKEQRNMFAMAEFTKSLAMSLNAAGLSPRVMALFNQARAARPFSWGRKAKVITGACLAIALRESNRPDLLWDIAFLLDEQHTTLSREFISITKLLNIACVPVDPSIYVPTLQAYLASLLREAEQASKLSVLLVRSLRHICLRSAAATASSVCTLVARHSMGVIAAQLTAPPTACAIFMLSLEAEQRATFSQLAELAECLGLRCHVGKGVIMARYKMIQDEIATWIENVPWLDKFDQRNGRSKVAKRLVVARGLKDVVRFQEEIWRDTLKPRLFLDPTENGNQSGTSAHEDEACTKSNLSTPDTSTPRPCKRRKTCHPYESVATFLVNPLASPLPSFSTPNHSQHLASSAKTFQLPLTTYFLTTSSSLKRPPTRLQLLAADRGGAAPEQISDEELFDEGEWETMLRSEDEIRVLRETPSWLEVEAAANATLEDPTEKTRKRRKTGLTENKEPKKSKVDLAALRQFLQDDEDPDQYLGLDDPSNFEGGVYEEEGCHLNIHDEDGDTFFQGGHVSYCSPSSAHTSGRPNNDDDNEVVVEDWRPMSP